MDHGDVEDPRLVAAVDLLRRTGSSSFQLRYSDDEEPVVWMALSGYRRPGDARSGNPAKRKDREIYEVAAAIDPLQAVLRLCAQLCDGGMCAHCQRPSGFSEDMDALPMDDLVCWYQWDPELETFRRGCEGS